MSDDAPVESRSGASRLTWSLWCCFLLFILYALAPAPILKLSGRPPPPGVIAAYAPLDYLYQHVETVRDFYDWYFKLWGVS